MGVVFQDRKSTNNICNNVVDVLKKTVHFQELLTKYI